MQTESGETQPQAQGLPTATRGGEQQDGSFPRALEGTPAASTCLQTPPSRLCDSVFSSLGFCATVATGCLHGLYWGLGLSATFQV
jgi:hypothetical protein